jgi:uncharacterized protein YrrD
MTTDAAILQHSNLMNRLVLERNTAEDLGRVDQLWLDGKGHQILGLSCKSGFLGRKRRGFTWAQIEAIGDESVLVSLADDGNAKKPDEAEIPLNHEVWSDDGNRAGRVVDYRFNRETGDVVDYLFVSNGWGGVTNGIYRLAPTAVISIGSKRMIVRKAAIAEPEQVEAGLADRVSKVAEFLKDDYDRTRQDMQGALEGTQAIASQLQSVGQSVGQTVNQNVVKPAQDAIDELSEADAPESQAAIESATDPAADPSDETIYSDTPMASLEAAEDSSNAEESGESSSEASTDELPKPSDESR